MVLLSGGLDSATTLAIARHDGYECYALSVSYGQRHSSELAAAARVAASLGCREHRVIDVDLASIGGSALTDPAIAIPEKPVSGIPITYVPARNTILLSLALAWAEVLKAEAIFVGVNSQDYSVGGDSQVWIRDAAGARVMTIAEACALPAGDYETLAVDPITLQVQWRSISQRLKHAVGGKCCYRLRLERGQEISITEDHSLFTIGFGNSIRPVRGSDIRPGTPLVVPFDLHAQAGSWSADLRTLNLRQSGVTSERRGSAREEGEYLGNRYRRSQVPLDFPVDDEFLRVAGMWLAEGGKSAASVNHCLAFSIGGIPGGPQLLTRYFAKFGISVRKSPCNDFDYRLDSSVAAEAFRRLDLYGTAKAADKHFPRWFWQLSQRQRRVMVAGFWDGDGCQYSKGEAPVHQKSHALIHDLYNCLLLDGIFPTLKRVAHSQLRLALSRSKDVSRFLDLYPLWHAAKRYSFAKAAAVEGRDKTTGLWKSAELWEAVAGSDLPAGTKTRVYNGGGKYDVSVRAQRSAFAEVPALRQLVNSKLAFLRVVAIDSIECEYMYDFAVPGAQNFLANGVLAHNSGYPDCRPEFIEAFKKLAAVATKAGVEGAKCELRAPILSSSKAEIIRMGVRLGVDYGLTVSCYQADERGRACGRCDSCRLRREGFEAAGVADPTAYA